MLTVLQVKSGIQPIINYALGILYYIKILIFIKFFYKKVNNAQCKTRGIIMQNNFERNESVNVTINNTIHNEKSHHCCCRNRCCVSCSDYAGNKGENKPSLILLFIAIFEFLAKVDLNALLSIFLS